MLSYFLAPEVIVTLCTGSVCAGVWLLRLEGRINLHKAISDAKTDTIGEGYKALRAYLDAEVLKREALEHNIRNDLTEIKLALARLVTIIEEKRA